ncbi:hypothetical protein C8F01DRAFT_966580, partial [Mycena amicta]
GDILARKLIIAIAERDRQMEEFAEVDKTIEPSLRQDWQRRVNLWIQDPSQPNPYLALREAQILADLKKAELAELRQGRSASGETTGKMSTAGFIKGALQLEDSQRRIRWEAKGTATLTAERSSQLDELRVAFFKKLRQLEIQQMVFMPGVVELRADEEERRDPDLPPPAAELTKLWVPSNLSEAERAWACKRGLAEIEAKLREGQCADSLSKLRGHLHAKTHLIDTRNATAVGQRATTRFGSLIGRVGDQVEREATKYREVLLALRRLKGPDHAPQFKELRDEDLQVQIESESDAKARAALGKLGAARRARNEPSLNRKMAPVSWIWFVGGDGDNQELHDSVRVQWAKTLARRDRWMEEVKLLQEEMRRVLRSLETVQSEWRERASVSREVDGQLAAGLKAYALRQAAVHQRIAASFRAKW